ncbi:MAG: GNAT family N-acetyltransferase [bacterium]|nr:GNAT family N-acetyltransferase [bacterium]
MSSAVKIRRSRMEDLLPAFKMVERSFNHLRKKHSMKPIKFPLQELPPVQKHLFATDGERSWCAWKGNKIVGYTHALLRGKQWYLGYLFIDPTLQDKGVGRKLLEKVYVKRPGMTHALCTFSYNMQAVGIYSQFGMVPIQGLAWLGRHPSKIKMPKPTGLQASTKLSAADLKWIMSLEKKVRGYERAVEWKFWTSNEHFEPFLFRDKGKRVAYGLIYKKMGIGPIGAVNNDYMVKAAAELIRRTNPSKKEEISIWVPTENIPLYQFMIKSGFRLGEIAVFMSDKSYTDFQRYCPTHLAIF